VTTDLKRLFVSNSGSGSVSVFDVDPRTDEFLEPLAEIPVGEHPKGLCCQPDMEDLFVCNFGSSTISIIDLKTNTVRKTLTSLLNQPWDMVAGPRQVNFGFLTGVFHGYISNFGGHNVLVYESGPNGIGGIGYDDILGEVPHKTGFLRIQSPRGMCWDPLRIPTGELSGGCYVAHRSGGHAVVTRIQFTNQPGPKGPIFLEPISGVPGFRQRVFEMTAQWGGPANPLSGQAAADVALLDYNRDAWMNSNWAGTPYVTNLGDIGNNPIYGMPVNNKHPIRYLTGQAQPTVLPDRLYISFQHTRVIDVVDPNGNQVFKTITGLPSPARVLKSYF
jgi:YVTN family beta-propeller protein